MLMFNGFVNAVVQLLINYLKVIYRKGILYFTSMKESERKETWIRPLGNSLLKLLCLFFY
jgi:hypothetical protein